ncbi:MAG TPA: TolC family protein [Alphaproteobacteria bacterium]
MRAHRLAAAALRFGRAVGIAAALAATPMSALPAHAAEAGPPPGATVDELLALARRLNPTLAARALDSDAATAKASAAGALEDPMLNLSRDEGFRQTLTTVSQAFPLWGKRGLARSIANAEALGARSRQLSAAVELDARVKTVFAQYWRATHAVEVTHDTHALLHAVAETAQRRYGQGLGQQADAIRSAVERSRVDLDFANLEREKRTAQGRINALLARAPGSPLTDPIALPPLPGAEALRIANLVDRARRNNPMLAEATSEIAAAEDSRRLVDKSWYPDVTVTLGQSSLPDIGPRLYAGVGLKVPLQWGLREAQAREATARAGAARSRLDASLLQLQGDLEDALAGLDAAKTTEALLTTTLQPQTDAAYRSALSSYQLGRGDLTSVLEAAHRVQEVRLELLKVQAEERMLLADIEKTIGDRL